MAQDRYTSLRDLNLPSGRERLSPHLRSLVKQEYERLYDQFDEDALAGVRPALRQKILSLRSSATAWLRSLGLYAEALLDLYEAEKFSLPSQGRVGAFLLYLADREGVVPDYICGEGYLDDAYVLEACIADLPTSERRSLLSYLSSNHAAE